MKMKSLAALGMASLLAASLSYMVPAMAEEPDMANVGADDTMLTLATNDTSAATDGSGMNSSMQQNDPTAGSNAPSDDPTTAPSKSDTSNTPNDQGTPDTATGDDDY